MLILHSLLILIDFLSLSLREFSFDILGDDSSHIVLRVTFGHSLSVLFLGGGDPIFHRRESVEKFNGAHSALFYRV